MRIYPRGDFSGPAWRQSDIPLGVLFAASRSCRLGHSCLQLARRSRRSRRSSSRRSRRAGRSGAHQGKKSTESEGLLWFPARPSPPWHSWRGSVVGASPRWTWARENGFKEVKEVKGMKASGQPVFQKRQQWISPDVDGHNTVTGWKVWTKKRQVGGDAGRLGPRSDSAHW